MSNDAILAQAKLQQWTPEFQRNFTARLTFFGKDFDGTGSIDAVGARDFRIKCQSRSGKPLFDARMNWAGVTVIYARSAAERGLVESVVRDVSAAMEQPRNLDRLKKRADGFTLDYTDAETFKHTHTFDAQHNLRTSLIEYSAIDKLTINFDQHTDHGPQQITISRPARLYRVAIQFVAE